MHELDGERDWAAVRRDVEADDMTHNAICRKHRISRGELLRRIRENRWAVIERDDLATRRTIIDGLFWALERQVEHLGEVELSTDGSKEAVVLNKLAATLEQLLEIDGKATGRTMSPRESREMQELRTKIARRLDELGIE